MGNAFVAGEVVYCIDSCRIHSAQPSTLHTTPRLENGRTPIFSSPISSATTTMVAYNARERVLYAWDNRRLVTYPIMFEEH